MSDNEKSARKPANPKALACNVCGKDDAFQLALHIDGTPPFWTFACSCSVKNGVFCIEDTTDKLVEYYKRTRVIN